MRKSEVKSSGSHSKSNPGSGPGRKGGAPAAPDVDPDLRRRMIAEAAYFMAEHRGFQGGDPVQDWLEAEAEITVMLGGGEAASAEETAAYRRLRDEVGKALSQVQDRIDAAAVKGAFERGMAELRHLEGVSAEAMQRAANALREDMRRAAERMGPSWEHFTENSAGLFSVWKDRSRDFLGRSADAVRQWLHLEHRGAKH
ncbi:MAG: DUF2934 domain-containing protein [Gammaproteobacteria bacterium]|nr:DUF2934 domain-containing protein [Gammaproteobacteria bacterium]